MKIYLAAQYHQKGSIRIKAEELRLLGHEVTSTWIDEPDPERSDLFPLNAAKDVREIIASDLLVLFTILPTDPFFRGGRHTEYGIALGLGKLTAICGPRENIFHHLLPNDLVFPTWEAFIEGMAR